MKRILFVFPNHWDRKQLPACREAWSQSFELEWTEPTDEDCPWDLDIVGYVERLVSRVRGKIDGVSSSSDYPGATVAGAVATALGLPGLPPETVIRCSHKYYSRLAQREVAGEAVPRVQLVDPNVPSSWKEIALPCYIKPVKGAFSVMSGRIDTLAELEGFLTRPAAREFLENYVFIFNSLVRWYTPFEINGSFFLAEGLLKGKQVTVEGFSQGGSVDILGIVDTVLSPETGSFLRFDYPTVLEPRVQERMVELARRVVAHLGLDNSLFNVEMIYDRNTDHVGIIEVNPRLCGQFADLYAKVDGTSGYEVALALAAGERPRIQRRRGCFGVAASFPLRIFEPMRVRRVPDAERIAEVETAFPGTLVWTECSPGQELTDFESAEDGKSYRYGVVNLGAAHHAELQVRFDTIRRALGFELTPL